VVVQHEQDRTPGAVGVDGPDLEAVLAADAWARRRARELLSTPVGAPSGPAGEGTA